MNKVMPKRFSVITYALLSTTILSGLVLSSSLVSADDSVVDTINITVPVACSLEGVGMNSHNATINPGTYNSEVGTTTLKAFCNDSNGFAIYAIGYTDNEYGKTVLTSSVSNSIDIVTGTATSAGNPDTSNWAMKLTAVSSPTPTYPMTIETGFDDYHAVPATYTKVASRASGTDIGTYAEGASLTTTYAAYIAKNQPAATYTGKVKYTLVHPSTNVPNEAHACASNKICYFPNAGNVVTDTMGDQSKNYNNNMYNIKSNMDVNLWPSNFKRPSYGFVGWSDAFDYVANVGSESNPNAHIYGPMEAIHLDDMTNGLSLYAVWVKSEGDLQGWTGCSALGSGKVTALTDTRDNDTYAVAKLADGNCWMIENLRLDYDANITTANTQSNNGSFGGVFAGLAQPEIANFINSSSSSTDSTEPNSLYYAGTGNQGNLGATIDILQEDYAGGRMPRYNNDNTNTNSTINPYTNVANMTGTEQNIYSYGNYYTWAAAIADTSRYNGIDNQSITTTSLCPTGWRLPQGGRAYASGSTSGVNVTGNPSTFRDFYNLGYILMGSSTTAYEDTPDMGTSRYTSNTTNTSGDTAAKALRKYPNNFLYSGIAYASSINGRGNSGDYWSSTTYNGGGPFELYMTSSYVYPGTNHGNRSSGYSIRCLVGS